MSCNSTRHIALNKGQCALIDEEDRLKLEGFRWYVGGRGYAVRYFREGGKRKSELMHRIVMGAQPDQQVDHINSDRLDNRKANLRFSTQSQNCMNRTKRSGCSSKYKGVNLVKGPNGQTYWRVECADKHVAHAPTEEEAARIYDRRAWELFGEFAKLNFPESDPSKYPPIVCAIHRWHGGKTCMRCGEPAPAHYRYRKNKRRHDAGVKQVG